MPASPSSLSSSNVHQSQAHTAFQPSQLQASQPSAATPPSDTSFQFDGFAIVLDEIEAGEDAMEEDYVVVLAD
ncbi:hypothetical protein FRC11_009199 [Ceratobasidium sp. 423]|nr:hypothetical protein FRC11_009199 [Ceratobasidium sp. 423]